MKGEVGAEVGGGCVDGRVESRQGTSSRSVGVVRATHDD